MKRRAQAAMEFLMTYGWAILVVLAAIGALAYFGVLSPDRFLPDKCTANPPFACNEYKLSQTTNLVYFTLQNSAGVDVNVTQISLSCNGVNAVNMSIAGVAAPTSKIIQNGNAANTTIAGASLPTGCSALSSGNKFKGSYTITYIKSGETISHTGSGSIQVRVES